MSLEQALLADRAGELEVAAAEYERVIASGDHSLRVLLNLALLYWQATDPGIAAQQKLSSRFLSFAAGRLRSLLDEAELRYPKSTAGRFWKRYIGWTDFGESLTSEECRRFLMEDPETLAPAIYLFATSGGREARAEARSLLESARLDGTTGARYIVSVLEAVPAQAESDEIESMTVGSANRELEDAVALAIEEAMASEKRRHDG